MPLYDFKCPKCGTIVENFRHHSKLDDPEICGNCGETMDRQFPTNTHAVIDSVMDSKPRGVVIKEKNEALKHRHAGYEHESHNLRQKINQQSQAIFGKSEY